MRKIPNELQSQKRNASCSLPVKGQTICPPQPISTPLHIVSDPHSASSLQLSHVHTISACMILSSSLQNTYHFSKISWSLYSIMSLTSSSSLWLVLNLEINLGLIFLVTFPGYFNFFPTIMVLFSECTFTMSTRCPTSSDFFIPHLIVQWNV